MVAETKVEAISGNKSFQKAHDKLENQMLSGQPRRDLPDSCMGEKRSRHVPAMPPSWLATDVSAGVASRNDIRARCLISNVKSRRRAVVGPTAPPGGPSAPAA